ncbi:hypothetical protein N6H14_20240 [Paenibacillus sp. CC-CFT747]|nr:hypothetical protein N6H14_20240 [Paenibacillus sp. CC-CFT747]
MIFTPAAALGEDVETTPAEREENNRRLKEEDQLRAAYEATFVQEPEASQLAEELGLPGDRVWNVLRKARGNSKEIAAFLREETPAFGGWALRLLEVINEKDLTDTFRPTLNEHLHGAMEVKGDTEDSIFASYVLNPRVLFEMLRPYRTFFRNAFYEVTSPYELADRIRNDIKIMQGYTYYQGSATPRGSLELGAADRISRDILFVAAARSLGMPSRLEPGDRRPQYREDGNWHDAFPEMQSGASGAKPTSGRITLTGPVPEGEKAEYFLHYTLARHEEGMFRTLQYRFGADGLIGEILDVLPGTYRLTTGRRLTDGSVLIRLHTFKVGPGDSESVEVVLREEMQQPDAAYGELGDEAARWLAGSGTLSQWLNGKGAVLAWVEPDREPTKHLIREIRERKTDFDRWGGRIALFAGDDKVNVPLGEHPWPDMPELAVFSSDAVYEGWNAVSAGLKDQLPMQFPIVLLVDPSGTVRYASAGYKLGRGEDLLRVISKF